MKKGDNVWWLDGLGFKHYGTVANDLNACDFMIAVYREDESIIRVAYKNLFYDYGERDDS